MIKIVLKSKKQSGSCPKATQDLELNTKNRNSSIKAEHIQYGPLNLSDEDYWVRAAKHWNTTPEVAKKSKCGNCTAFDVSPRMLDCLPGPVSEPIEDKEGKLGYCWMHHFKCHSARTCYTWAAGGPISKDDVSYEWQEKNEQSVTEDDSRGFTMKKENLSRQDIERIVREELTSATEGKICDKGISYVIRTDPGGKDIKRGEDKDGDGKGDLQNWSARAAQIASKYCKDPNYGKGRGKDAKDENLEEDCWDGYERVEGSVEGAPGSCKKKTDEAMTEAEGGLKAWEKENWTHSDGTPCGGGKKDGSKSRCKPASKWKTMSKGEKAADNRKKAKGTKAGKQYVSATKKGKVTKKHTKRNESTVRDDIEAIVREELSKARADVIEEIEYNYIPAHDATYDDGTPIDFLLEFWDDVVVEAEYRGKKVKLNKPTRGDVKKFKVYVNSGKKTKDGKIKAKKVNFGDPKMRIKKSNPKRRKSFRARHNCDTPGPKTKARYWSCRKW